jgi:D-alanyl-lipoteichoic acid acyltransferase DltB (MBOAT superfamily)
MLFNSWGFVAFFVCLLLVLAPLRHYSTAWRCVMLAASYFFYGQWSWGYLGLILASTVADYWLALRIAGSARPRRYIVLSVALNLAFLGFFKYANFLIETGNAGLALAHAGVRLTPLDIVLPVGISFFTFQAMSYTMDVYRRQIEPRRRFLDYALFIAFFPQLLSGPIVRAREFFTQLDHPRPLTAADTQHALVLIAMGYVKKVVFADTLAEVVNPIWANVAGHDPGQVLLAIYGFAFQIYFDFSGYTDIAIGIALLLGFRFPKNFNYPYAALSVQDFWRRWHMTLSRWLRDYLYISLGGSRGSRARTYANLFVTMLLGGLWHGASWNFVVWGGLHGAYLAVERALRGRLPGMDPTSLPGRALRWFVTFNLVCFAWIFFRSPDFATSMEVLRKLASLPSEPLHWAPLRSTAIFLLAAVAWQAIAYRLQVKERLARAGTGAFAAASAAMVLLVIWFTPGKTAPFIYFQF